MKLLLKNLLFTCVAPGTVAGIVPWLLTRNGTAGSGWTLAVASALFAVGGAIYSWCVWDFAAFGRGTPAPIDAPVKLVVRGLYRFSRNPMYVGVLTVIAGWSVMYRAADVAVYGVFVAVAFNTFIRLYEEPHLEQEFGDEYAAYRDRVGRWLSKPNRPTPQSSPPRSGSAADPGS